MIIVDEGDSDVEGGLGLVPLGDASDEEVAVRVTSIWQSRPRPPSVDQFETCVPPSKSGFPHVPRHGVRNYCSRGFFASAIRVVYGHGAFYCS